VVLDYPPVAVFFEPFLAIILFVVLCFRFERAVTEAENLVADCDLFDVGFVCVQPLILSAHHKYDITLTLLHFSHHLIVIMSRILHDTVEVR
jgi:hypothetical protein